MSWRNPGFQSRSDQGLNLNSVFIVWAMMDKLLNFSLVEPSYYYGGGNNAHLWVVVRLK